MSEGSLVNRYRQYKAGTSKIVTWLAQTARQARDVTNILPSLKAANDAAKQAKRTKRGPTPDTNVKVTTTQLFSLAQVIVDAAVPVSDDILRTFRTVIAGREGCATFYQSIHASSEQRAANDGHHYFIKVLKDILDLFEKSKKAKSTSKTSGILSSKTTIQPVNKATDSLTNVFELLQIDEPSINPLGSAPTKANKVVTFELETTHDEKTFAVWCLLQDFRELRQELKSFWLEYKSGAMSFNNVSTLTVVGLDLFHSAEKEFTNQYPDLRSYPALLAHFNLIVGATCQEVFICPDKGKSLPASSQVNKDEIAGLLCPRAWVILMGFVEYLSQKIGRYNLANEPRLRGVQWLDAHPLGQALKSLLPQFEAMSRQKKDSRDRSDAFLSSLHTLADHPSYPPPIWVVAACQVHMDIYETIGTTADHEMSMSQARLTADIECIQGLHRIVSERFVSEPGQPKHILLIDCDEMVADLTKQSKDPYYQTSRGRSTSTVKSNRTVQEEFPVSRVFPMKLGTVVDTGAVAVHNRGVTCCDTDKIVLSAAYLYRAARIIGAITTPWPDMDHVIETQNRSQSFVLQADSVISMAKCFALAIGIKPQALRRGQRPSPSDPCFVERNAKHMMVDWPLVTKIVVNDRAEKIDMPKNITPTVQVGIKSIERLQKFGLGSPRLNEIYQGFKKTGRLTIAQLLLGMKETADADETDLHFDYISFFEDCFDLLAEIDSRCAPDPMRPTTLGKDDGVSMPFHESVYSILWDAADHSESNTSMKRSMLYLAGTIMEQMIQKQANKYLNLAQEKINGLRRPSTMLFKEAAETKASDKQSDHELVRKFFGLPNKELRSTGMFCSCKEEVEARVEVIRLRSLAHFRPEQTSTKEIWQASCNVMNFTLASIADGEQEQTVQALYRALQAFAPDIFGGLSTEDVLGKCLAMGMLCASGKVSIEV